MAAESGFAHLSSDVVRKRAAGVPLHAAGPARLYDDIRSRDTYARLGAAAGEALRRGGGVVIDATFRRPVDRAAFLEAFDGDDAALTWVWCSAPPDVLAERARARTGDPDRVSDATPEVVRRQLREQPAPADPLPGRRVTIRTDRAPGEVVDALRAELDGTLAGTPKVLTRCGASRSPGRPPRA